MKVKVDELLTSLVVSGTASRFGHFISRKRPNYKVGWAEVDNGTIVLSPGIEPRLIIHWFLQGLNV